MPTLTLLKQPILERSCKQYLAVAPFPSKEYTPTIGARLDRPAAACIQIWSLGPKNPKDEVGEAQCEMVLCIDSGPAHMLRWCPLPSHDPVRPPLVAHWETTH